MGFADAALRYLGLKNSEPKNVKKPLPAGFLRSIDNILERMLLERDHEKLRQYESSFHKILEYFSTGEYDNRYIGAAMLAFFNITPRLPDYHGTNTRKYPFKLIKS